ncbi:glycosyltransferase family 2 protein [Crenobacter caeni]|uniref:Glycosyltransferase family 2 protein n=1 Tax=Crenobacter caeni TaxID=2705474 RepID=A0A6B2KTD9_9NEIS|nr:glycosyltransferase family 2 protein [Crenobacter caeni]NDV13293.1 glycosyltransferase family 2 protein [Crenobacter caeni]
MKSQKNQPLVSILVPCYNHQKYIKTCLESLKNQDYGRIELIIIDDGSTDSSYEIIKTWSINNKNYFENLSHKKTINNGITKTLSTLVNESNGEYIAFCASDDKLDKASITSRLKGFTSDNTAAVFGKAKLINGEDKILSDDAAKKLYGANFKNKSGEQVVKELFFRWSLVGPVTMYRRSAIMKAGGIDTRYIAEDRSLFLRIIKQGDYSYIDEHVAEYRIHNKSITRNISGRLIIPKDIATLHVEQQFKFTGIRHLHLKSNRIDLTLMCKIENGNYLCLIPLLLFRVTRKLLVALYLKTSK